MLLFEEEDQTHTEADWHAAIIASEVRRGYVKHSGDVRTKDFLLPRRKSKPKKKLTKEERVAREKAAWSILVRPVVSGRTKKRGKRNAVRTAGSSNARRKNDA